MTLSGNLSGSFASAKVAEGMYKEEGGRNKVRVFDGFSSSVGEMQLVLKILAMKEAGADFETVSREVYDFSREKKTKFVLESLDNLRKNGRLGGLSALIAEVMNIKPICAGTVDGKIEKIAQARGMKRALTMLADLIAKDAVSPEERLLAIAHVDNRERAEFLREEVEKRVHFKETVIVNTRGLCTLYADDGGIIASY